MIWMRGHASLCLSCIVTAAICLFMAISGSPWKALFVFSIYSVVISGWKSGDQDLFLLAVVMLVSWSVYDVSYHAVGLVPDLADKHPGLALIPNLIDFVSHVIIAILAFGRRQRLIASLSALIVVVATGGAIAPQFMPWLEFGNALFLLTGIAFVAICYNTSSKAAQKDKPKTVTGSVVNLEARRYARARQSIS